MSIDISIIGRDSHEIEKLLRSSGMRVTTAPPSDLLRLVQPGAKPPAVIVLDVRKDPNLPGDQRPIAGRTLYAGLTAELPWETEP